jgi:electron transport complex protein RnfD
MPWKSTCAISSPHIHSGVSVAGVMRRVLLALVPGVIVSVWCFGPGVLLQIVVAVAAALAAEATMLSVRAVAPRPFLLDGTAVVAGVLLGLAMPPLAPWWFAALGAVFAMVVVKHAYGGVGHNLFNPAMAGYALLLVCFPYAMQSWPEPGGGARAAEVFSHVFVLKPVAVDAVSGATALSFVRDGLQGMRMLSELHPAPAMGLVGGSGVEWVNLAFLAGGLALLIMRVIRWQIPVGFISGLFLASLLLHLGDAERHASPLFHLMSGASMLGAFFIATDPVSSPVTPRGRLIFGLLVGVLVIVIRRFGHYPDGVAFAVLLMNAAAPLIDRYTRPRVFGERGT